MVKHIFEHNLKSNSKFMIKIFKIQFKICGQTILNINLQNHMQNLWPNIFLNINLQRMNQNYGQTYF